MSGKMKARIEKRDKRWVRLDSIIYRDFSTSFMNNTKWIKLLRTACSFYPDIRLMNYKLVYSDEVKSTIIEEYEEQIDDYWFIEPSIYREFEWLEFPFQGNTKLKEFEMQINQLGKFQLISTSTSLRVLGYARV